MRVGRPRSIIRTGLKGQLSGGGSRLVCELQPGPLIYDRRQVACRPHIETVRPESCAGYGWAPLPLLPTWAGQGRLNLGVAWQRHLGVPCRADRRHCRRSRRRGRRTAARTRASPHPGCVPSEASRGGWGGEEYRHLPLIGRLSLGRWLVDARYHRRFQALLRGLGPRPPSLNRCLARSRGRSSVRWMGSRKTLWSAASTRNLDPMGVAPG